MEYNKNKISLVFILAFALLIIPNVSAVILTEGTIIETSGNKYNTTILINSTLDLLTVTSTNIQMDNVNFLAIQNLNLTNPAIIDLTGLLDAQIIYSNGTRYIISGFPSLALSATGQLYIVNNNNIILDDGLTTYLRFNENSGLVAHDISGNLNDGVITGATWKVDNAFITLIKGDNFQTLGNLFTILTDGLSWSEINIVYTTTGTDLSCPLLDTDELSTGFRAFALGIITFLGLIGLILGIVWLISYLKPLFSPEEGIGTLAGN